MKLVAFVLSLISYGLVLLFFYFIFNRKPQKENIVYIHTAIVTKNFNLNQNRLIKRNVITHTKAAKKIPKPKKNTKKLKIGSKSSFTKGGNVNFNDIFKNVHYNISTKKVNLEKQNSMSRFKGQIFKQLNKIKNINININISYNTHSNVSKGKINELINKIYEIWNNISFIPGEYAIIKFINNNGNINVLILDSNLNIDKQKELIEGIKNIKYNKNIDITIKFQTKVNK